MRAAAAAAMCWLVRDCMGLWSDSAEESNPDEGLEFLVTLFGLSVLSYFIGGGGGLFLTMLGWLLAFCILECRGFGTDGAAGGASGSSVTPLQVGGRKGSKGRKQR
eukprot:SAG22_NODE_270_length_13234_cov_13.248573_6_plen_106_part_00